MTVNRLNSIFEDCNLSAENAETPAMNRLKQNKVGNVFSYNSHGHMVTGYLRDERDTSR